MDVQNEKTDMLIIEEKLGKSLTFKDSGFIAHSYPSKNILSTVYIFSLNFPQELNRMINEQILKITLNQNSNILEIKKKFSKSPFEKQNSLITYSFKDFANMWIFIAVMWTLSIIFRLLPNKVFSGQSYKKEKITKEENIKQKHEKRYEFLVKNISKLMEMNDKEIKKGFSELKEEIELSNFEENLIIQNIHEIID